MGYVNVDADSVKFKWYKQRTAKAMDDTHDLMLNENKVTLLERSIESYFKKQETKIWVEQMWSIVCQQAFWSKSY